ncbi:MAG: tRNA uridine(34) 5-carboxymethylaminomethyl modification radical SAM/GNAT enzyme Elp3 [Candidatus Aenigmatarchaeota archaeon]
MSMIRSEERKEVAEEVLEVLLKEDIPREEVHSLKTRIASEHGCKIPSNEEVLELASGEEREKVLDRLRRRPSRSKSGVSIVAVMTSPEECPHGTCVYCPRDEGAPQSYVDNEPAVMRAQQNGFDPYKQTERRLEQLELTGHHGNKIELIVMGGTFPARDYSYQKEFVKGCFDAFNQEESESLEEAKRKNEEAEHRCVGLTVETRPDYCKEKEIKRMLNLGTTRVELGVQVPDDDVYRKVDRGHSVEDVAEATKLLKDSGLKVTYHYMPGLPGSDFQQDLEYFEKLFSDWRFMPDALKIYPTLVVKNSELEELYEKGEYEPYSDEELIDLMVEVRKRIPPWVRVMRLNRDVPAEAIVGGCKKSNLRQIVSRELEERGKGCRCIRCREVGRSDINKELEFELVVRSYRASDGKEYFLSFENKEEDVIAALLRLRIPNEPFVEDLNKDTGLVRELHVYGPEVPLEGKNGGVQHHGYGRRLLKRAEEIADEKGMDELAVISGVGARNYYRKLGYKLAGNYMVKGLKS